MNRSSDSLRCQGMRDLLPDEMRRFRQVEQVFRSTCEAWGFGEVRTPVVEPLHLFTSSGALSPNMLGRVYSFLDWDGWSGERVVLRPDGTIPAARLYREHFSGEIGKFFYVEDIFRFSSEEEKREIWQCGAELIGDTWPLGDVEVITVARETLVKLGLANVVVRLSHTGIVRAILATAGYSPDEQAALYDRIVDGELGVLDAIEQRLPQLGAPLRLLFDGAGGQAAYLENLRGAFVESLPAILPPLNELGIVASTLQAARCPYELDLTMVREFEYYTGPVFRLFVDGRAAGGGGRYDHLVASRDGTMLPACGFALEISDIMALLPSNFSGRRLQPVQVRPASLDPAAMALALTVSAELQGDGFSAELIAPEQSPACRWRLTVDPRPGQAHYQLEDCSRGTSLSAGSMEQVMASIDRGNAR